MGERDEQQAARPEIRCVHGIKMSVHCFACDEAAGVAEREQRIADQARAAMLGEVATAARCSPDLAAEAAEDGSPEMVARVVERIAAEAEARGRAEGLREALERVACWRKMAEEERLTPSTALRFAAEAVEELLAASPAPPPPAERDGEGEREALQEVAALSPKTGTSYFYKLGYGDCREEAVAILARLAALPAADPKAESGFDIEAWSARYAREYGKVAPPAAAATDPKAEAEPTERREPLELLELAWGLIANSYGGDWERASAEWTGAAERWRNQYFALLSSSADPEPGREAVEREAHSRALARSEFCQWIGDERRALSSRRSDGQAHEILDRLAAKASAYAALTAVPKAGEGEP